MKPRTAADRQVRSYLRALEVHLGPLPVHRRRQLVADVADHIAEARDGSGAADDPATVRAILERVGDPADIAAETLAVEPPRGEVAGGASGRGDAWAPWLLLLGGFALGIGWVVGAVLLLGSSAWRARDKAIGLLLWPFGLAGILFLLGLPAASTASTASGCSSVGPGSATACTPSAHGAPVLGLVVLAAVVVVQAASTWWLLRTRHSARW